mgnify:FL=1
MCAENQDVFAEFQFIHDLYQQNRQANQVVFNEQGVIVRRIIEDWDRRLCSQMEKGSNATYSARLSEKFWGLVKTRFPLIDFVGATVH